jgi:CheY-like chemotaxis protein
MEKDVIILIAEDDEGHAALIKKNLRSAGLANKVLHFRDGEEVLNYLFRKGDGEKRLARVPYLLLLDIRMPKIDGIEVLNQVKKDPELRKLPIIMITTTDDPKEVEKCHNLGCSNYITKPINYEKFVNAIQQLGLFLMVVQIPELDSSS